MTIRGGGGGREGHGLVEGSGLMLRVETINSLTSQLSVAASN